MELSPKAGEALGCNTTRQLIFKQILEGLGYFSCGGALIQV